MPFQTYTVQSEHKNFYDNKFTIYHLFIFDQQMLVENSSQKPKTSPGCAFSRCLLELVSTFKYITKEKHKSFGTSNHFTCSAIVTESNTTYNVVQKAPEELL